MHAILKSPLSFTGSHGRSAVKFWVYHPYGGNMSQNNANHNDTHRRELAQKIQQKTCFHNSINRCVEKR